VRSAMIISICNKVKGRKRCVKRQFSLFRSNSIDSKLINLDELEKTVKFPITIIGTRKPNSFNFWAWDSNLSGICFDTLNPYLFLTFKDATGKIIGPVRYNSRLRSWGIKLEFSLFRVQFGNLRLGTNSVTYNTIPRELHVFSGWDNIIPSAGVASISYTPLTIPPSGKKEDTKTTDQDKIAEMMKLTYFSMTQFGAGSTKITNGFFEAEPEIVSAGLSNWAEKLGIGVLLLIGILWGCGMILPTLHMLGYLDTSPFRF